MRGQRRTGRTLAAAGLVLALLGAACADSGGDGGANAGSGGDSSSPAATGAGGGGGYGGYGGGGGGGSTGSSGSGGGGAMTLTQVNFLFTPAKLTVKQGDTITVKNTNPSTPHTFTVTGTDIDVANDPLASKDVAIDLEPGTYDFVCRFHEGQGMIGTLVVK